MPFSCKSKEDKLLENACFDNARSCLCPLSCLSWILNINSVELYIIEHKSNSFNRDSCASLTFNIKDAGASSIVSEWGLVCDLNYKSKVMFKT